MKRINLSVNLEDNELFEKSFKEQLEAYARQIAREQLDTAISKEIERIVKNVTSDFEKTYTSRWHGNEMRSKVKESVSKAFNEYKLGADDIRREALNAINAEIARMVAPSMEALAKSIRADNAAVIGKLIETMVSNKQ